MVSTSEHGICTDEELEKIRQLRSRVATELKTKYHNEDAFLLTWLRARNLNVDKAEEMLRKSLKWRESNNIDGIFDTEIPEKYKNNVPLAYLGMEDGTGCPVFLFMMGRYDLRAVIEEDGAEAAMRYCMYFSEKNQQIMKENAKLVGHPVTSFIELVDLEGFSLRQMATRQCREIMAQQQRLMDENYPESMKLTIFINAPKVFAFLYNMMRPLISKRTLDKMEILGSDVETWKAVVSKKIPMNLVPRHWGGTRIGNDEYCSDSDMWIVGPLGLKYFSKEDPDGFSKVTVNARDQFQIEFEISDPDLKLEWKFKTDSYDIAFGIYLSVRGDVIPVKRVDSHKFVQEGLHHCETVGTYKLVFDNTYSYSRAKTLRYKVDIIH